MDDTLRKWAKAPIICWSLDTEDWKDPTPSRITADILRQVKDGDIILMHDIFDTSVTAALAAVDQLLAQESVKSALAFAEQDADQTLENQIELCKIEAPTAGSSLLQPPPGAEGGSRTMKKIIGVAILAAAAVFVLAALIHQGQKQENQDPQVETQQEVVLPDSGHTLKIQGSDGQITQMDLNQYLWGVVAAEMPASFHEEALKAQAVAARTYALHRGATNNHPDADLCTDYRCCQAWIAKDQAQSNWGDKAIEYTNKITAAVADTANQVILYDGQLIDAVFHSSSASATQDAVEVWGNSVPYLQSVTSPEGDGVPDYESQVTFSSQEFKDKFSAAQPDAVFGDDPAAWVTDTQRTTGGSVHSVTIGGVTVTGAQARTIFGLRSATFTLTYADGTFTFSVTGFGHGVGMSQYGADAMAEEGKTYSEILQHYYTGVTVEECPAEFFKN